MPNYCPQGNCVDIERVQDNFLFTSTVAGNEESVTYTPAEVAQFLTDVKAGKWDAVHAEAGRLAAREVATV